MKTKRQKKNEKQLKNFVSELEKLSEKYGIVISVNAKSVKYGKIQKIKYNIGSDYGTKIFVQNVEYEKFKFDENKTFNLNPDDRGFYMFIERELKNPIKAIEHWTLVHSFITQISSADPVAIKDFLDEMGYQTWYLIFRADRKMQIEQLTKIYIEKIEYHLTQYLNSYEELRELE